MNTEENMFDVQFQELRKIFTSDAWSVLISFLKDLEDRMKAYNVTWDDRKSVLQGLKEFIRDFYYDQDSTEKISFHPAIKLIQEMGSPTEIIQALNYSTPTSTPTDVKTLIKEPVTQSKKLLACKACNWPNHADALYCENCGRKLMEKQKTSVIFWQRFINHPYIISFLMIFFLTTIALGYPEPSFVDPSSPNISIIDIIISFVVPFGIGMLIALVAGLIINTYCGDIKSFSHYKKVLNRLQDNYGMVIGLIFLSFFLFIITPILEPIKAPEYYELQFNRAIKLYIGVTIASAVLVSLGQKPDQQSVSYITLLKVKQTYDQFLIKKMLSTSVILLLPIMIWTYISLTYFYAEIALHILLLLWISQICTILLATNALVLSYYLSWWKIMDYVETEINFSKKMV